MDKKPFSLSSNKGQALSGDFIISIAIFLFVLAIVLPLFSQIADKVGMENAQRELETRSVFVSDAMIKTTGFPADWNSTTVKTIGFSDGNTLNMTKIRSFLNMSYSSARDALSLADLEFNITFQGLDGYGLLTGASQSPVAYFYVVANHTQNHLNSQPAVWDLYYGSAGSFGAGNSRNQYNGSKVAVFNSMVGNQSIYKTIIIEEPQLTQPDVNIQGLKDFVRSGGVLIFIGSAELISTGFSMSSATDIGAPGLVANENGFVDASQNENVTFNNSRWYFYNTTGDSRIEIFVADKNSPSAAFIGRWNYGLGTIYFLTDIIGTIGTNQLSSSVNIVGKKMEHGTPLLQAESVYVIQRSAILRKDKDMFAKITLVTWKS